MRLPVSTAALVLSVLLVGCAAHTSLQPVGKRRLSGNLGVGGPIVNAFNTYLPVPYATAGANYGLTDQVNLNTTVHLLPIAYGIIGLDFGATYFPVVAEGRKATIGVQPQIMVLASVEHGVTDRVRLVPILTGTAAWRFRNDLVYSGVNLTVPLYSPDYDEEVVPFILSPFVGYRWTLGQQLRLLSEIKWHAVNVPSDPLAVTYTNIAGRGAITPLLSLEWTF